MATGDRDLEKGQDGVVENNTDRMSRSSTLAAPKSPVSERASNGTVSSANSQAPLNSNKSILKRRPIFRLGFLGQRNRRTPKPDRKHIVRKIDKQILGYPKLATFQDSDENFMVYRRFGFLQARLLLERQDDLRRLELKLDSMDVDDAEDNADDLRSRAGYHGEHMKHRRELLDLIESKWLDYVKLLQAAQAMVSMNKPTSYEHHSVWNWLESSRAIDSPEDRFIRCKEDLVTLRPGREHAWLDAMTEHALRWSKWKALNDLFRTQDTKDKSDGSDKVMLYTRSRIEQFVVSIITIMIIVLLVVPIYLLYHLTEGDEPRQSSPVCIGVLLVSTLAFSACLSLFTRAKRHEILAASAAYCAVLVVFLGNI